MAYANSIHRHDLGLADRFGATVTALRSRWEQYRRYRQTLAELRSLSRRELDDLGINATMIRSIALEVGYGTAKEH